MAANNLFISCGSAHLSTSVILLESDRKFGFGFGFGRVSAKNQVSVAVSVSAENGPKLWPKPKLVSEVIVHARLTSFLNEK